MFHVHTHSVNGRMLDSYVNDELGYCVVINSEKEIENLSKKG